MKYVFYGIIGIVFLPITLLMSKNLELKKQLHSVSNSTLGQLVVLKDDFRVNDDTTGGCKQSTPAIGMSNSGNIIVAWEDF